MYQRYLVISVRDLYVCVYIDEYVFSVYYSYIQIRSFFLTFTTYPAFKVVRLNRSNFSPSFFVRLAALPSLLLFVVCLRSYLPAKHRQCLAHASHDEGRGSFSAELSKCAININTRNDNYSGRC